MVVLVVGLHTVLVLKHAVKVHKNEQENAINLLQLMVVKSV